MVSFSLQEKNKPFYPNHQICHFKKQYGKFVKKRGGWLKTIVTLSLLLFSALSYAKELPLISLKQSSQQVWQRQQVLITLEITTKDPFSRLEAAEFQQKGWDITAYPLQRIEGKTQTQLILKWLVFPFMSGKQVLKMPEIVYRPNRRRKQILPIKNILIQVRHLPVYIPPTMPVGKITLESLWNNGRLIKTQELTEWQVQVTGNNVVKQTMPAIKRQLVSNKSLKILPIQSTSEMLKTETGIINQRIYKIPLKAQNNGKLQLPKIEVQYFEPETGKLQKTSINPPFVFVLNHGLFWILLSLGTFLFLYVLFKLLFFITKQIKEYLKLKQAINLLDKAKNYPQMRSAIIQLSVVEGWDDNLSLSKFLQKWETKFGKSSELKKRLEKLQMQYFSGRQNTTDKTKHSL